MQKPHSGKFVNQEIAEHEKVRLQKQANELTALKINDGLPQAWETSPKALVGNIFVNFEKLLGDYRSY
ncbi:MAG: hypothetical protein WED07_02375 [Candidatus Freyarchaeum deiterrae]